LPDVRFILAAQAAANAQHSLEIFMSAEIQRNGRAADFELDPATARCRRISTGSVEPAISALARRLIAPGVAAGMLLLLIELHAQQLDLAHIALTLIVFLTTSQLVSPARWATGRGVLAWLRETLPRFFLEWICLVAMLLLVGVTVSAAHVYSQSLFWQWVFAAPIAIILVRLAGAHVPAPFGAAKGIQRHIVIGANEVGLELNRRATNIRNSTFLGFFDDRQVDYLAPECRKHLAGTNRDVVAFVHRMAVDTIYISLPLKATQQVTRLLNDLRDTTASVYLVPDIFSFDVIQPRFVDMDGLPVVSVHDTPFYGSNALLKRSTDIVAAAFALLLLWPAMLAISVGVKMSSPGPVLFRQRRYGMNGEEIVVYKFRSMTVCEDGLNVVQATRLDRRVTRFGRFLRRTSLDELPQILNILEGGMSLVGPRPHAVAHNEKYRKLISGYMLRHKVRPGLTGWAQVHGLRGETDTVEKMRKRVEYDIDYLKNWSFWLDMHIILRTIRMLSRDTQAY
jgi:putative colanic acid biosysnthesis UDP-glucose lipid carrier transferase